MPLFISAGFVLCHVFSVYLPTVEINVEVIEENRGAEGTSDHEEVIIYIGKMILRKYNSYKACMELVSPLILNKFVQD